MTPEELADAGLRYDVTGAVATVTLDRPEVRNAQTPRMWRALAAIGDEVPDDVRVVVRARRRAPASRPGSTARCSTRPVRATASESVAGLLSRPDDEVVGDHRRLPARLHLAARPAVRLDRRRPGPRDRGRLPARAVLRPAGGRPTTRSFCMKEAALGLVPDLTGTKPLVESVGYARALEICATARVVGAAEALADRAGDRRSARWRARRRRRRPGGGADGAAARRGPRDQGAAASRRRAGPWTSSGDCEREAQIRRFRELAGLMARLASERRSADVDASASPRGAPALRPRRRREQDRARAPCAASSGSPGRTAALIALFLVGHRPRRRPGRRTPAADAAARRRRHPRPTTSPWSSGWRSAWPSAAVADAAAGRRSAASCPAGSARG